jgi:hypothetical protein
MKLPKVDIDWLALFVVGVTAGGGTMVRVDLRFGDIVSGLK